MKIIDDFKPHIVHGAVFEGITLAAINGFIKQVPVVLLEETSDPQNRRWKGNLLLKILCCFADKVIGVSPASTEYLKNKLKLPQNKIILINNSVVIPEILNDKTKNELKAKYLINEDDVVFGSVGRMTSDEHKRFSDLIKAFAILAQNHPKVKLILVGEGEERINYEELVKKKGIQDKVIFAGYQEDVALYYSLFDVFSLVSAYEAFGLVLVEAMLHKLPIVATRVGGMQYIVDDLSTGFLVEKYNIDDITEKLLLLSEDESLRKKYGQNGFIKAMNEYTEERYVKDVEQLYFDLIKNKKITIG